MEVGVVTCQRSLAACARAHMCDDGGKWSHTFWPSKRWSELILSPQRFWSGRRCSLFNHPQCVCPFLPSFLFFWQKQGGSSTKCHLSWCFQGSTRKCKRWYWRPYKKNLFLPSHKIHLGGLLMSKIRSRGSKVLLYCEAESVHQTKLSHLRIWSLFSSPHLNIYYGNEKKSFNFVQITLLAVAQHNNFSWTKFMRSSQLGAGELGLSLTHCPYLWLCIFSEKLECR